MKTILEWFNELPEPYKSEAISNCDDEMLAAFADCQDEAIATAFCWELTPQGFKYWSDLQERFANELVDKQYKKYTLANEALEAIESLDDKIQIDWATFREKYNQWKALK